jgi:hypothetical protein
MATKDAGRVLETLRTSEEEFARLKAIERSGDVAEYAKAMGALEKRQALRGLATVKGLDKGKINGAAFRAADDPLLRRATPNVAPALVAGLLQSRRVACDCLVPFGFASLKTFGALSGPDLTDVRNGILGAVRLTDAEYTVNNPGTTDGKTRMPLNGQMHLTFTASIPTTGRYYVLLPAGNLWVRGHTKVVGHGNATTSYDAKVWVDYYQLLYHEGDLLEIAGGGIHYDATRSESRTKYFNQDVVLEPRYVVFQAAAGEQLVLSLRLELDTEANEDGVAVAVVDYFGFPANLETDYDTFLIRS